MLDVVTRVARTPGEVGPRLAIALRGLIELTGSSVAVAARVRRARGSPLGFDAVLDLGWDDRADRQACMDAVLQPGSGGDPFLDAALDRVDHNPRSLTTFSRRQLVPDEKWYGVAHVATPRRLGGVDDCLVCVHPLPGVGHYACLVLMRRWGEPRPFGPRERDIADCLWHALGYLHETALPAPRRSPDTDLAPELLPVLALLKSAGPLRDAPRKLGMTPTDFRRRLNAVYAHFDVGTRVALLAKLAGG
jgi:hypothetical protein